MTFGNYFKYKLHFPELSSTQDKAHGLLDEGVSPPFLVTADHQTKGRGSSGRSWHCVKNGVYVTFAFNPALNWKPTDYSWFASLAVLDCFEKLTNKREGWVLKWPNDVLWEKKKISGILCEWVKERSEAVLVGVGINIDAEGSELLLNIKDFHFEPSTLSEVAGRNFLKSEVLEVLSDSFEVAVQSIMKKGRFACIERWNKRCNMVGRKVQFFDKKTDQVFDAQFEGINIEGHCVLLRDGKTMAYGDGEIRCYW